MLISVNYSLKWQFTLDHKYQWSKCGKLINVRTGNIIKKAYNSGSIGYWLNGKFYTLTKLRSLLITIPKEYIPF